MHDAALPQTVAAALDWWRLAGVDQDYGEAKGWLREAETKAAPAPQAPATPAAAIPAKRAEPEAPPPPALGGPAEQWPTALPAFRQWWLAEPSLGPASDRLPSRGEAGAALLVLVAQPEAEDAAAGQLLSGEQGRLIAAMLRAMGIAADQAALMALLPRHTPFADWDGLASAGLGALARHHLALHAPARVLVLGHGNLPLLGLDPAQSPALLPLSGQEGSAVPLLGAPSVEVLLARPAARAALWRNWLEWTQQA